ncbi:hypothetical protein Tco_0522518 [Tanacetum coccineum]
MESCVVKDDVAIAATGDYVLQKRVTTTDEETDTRTANVRLRDGKLVMVSIVIIYCQRNVSAVKYILNVSIARFMLLQDVEDFIVLKKFQQVQKKSKVKGKIEIVSFIKDQI